MLSDMEIKVMYNPLPNTSSLAVNTEADYLLWPCPSLSIKSQGVREGSRGVVRD